MGMPDSKSCLEELMSRILGNLIQEDAVAKIADDLYCGGSTIEETYYNWSRIRESLARNNLRLSARKTTLWPKTTAIFGWIWSSGTLQASPHTNFRLLQSATAPSAFSGLRSFIGAYKDILPFCYLWRRLSLAETRRRKSFEPMICFMLSPVLRSLSIIPRLSIHHVLMTNLGIGTDASLRHQGLAATLCIKRNDNLLFSGFFNAQLKNPQLTWLPWEIEALSITAAVKHFSPFIIQSHLRQTVDPAFRLSTSSSEVNSPTAHRLQFFYLWSTATKLIFNISFKPSFRLQRPKPSRMS